MNGVVCRYRFPREDLVARTLAAAKRYRSYVLGGQALRLAGEAFAADRTTRMLAGPEDALLVNAARTPRRLSSRRAEPT